MQINLNKRKFNVTSKDRILDNGSCYQLITHRYYKNFGYICPVISKTMFKKLLKEGKIILLEEKSLTGCDLYAFMEMEEDEAIYILENTSVIPNIHPDEQWKWDKAIEMAIKALKEKRGV